MLTATAAGTLLGALWFVPSANASGDEPARQVPSTSPTTQVTQQARVAATSDATEVELADTGSFDTTPYVVGGTFSLALGAGFVVYSVRRERHGF
ncbi:LPXTG cell wall anchor domain-containing protein [Streptomyces davaonensis]|uniref:LPXTG cell wall anchor domain-containing protein n=1 Tax=Streptomyces davaonensis TaxID=348043 RepID=UPI0005A0F30B|nr:LPXTG cell wall anchor domain-containing protein [Streptomyces davaonensis]